MPPHESPPAKPMFFEVRGGRIAGRGFGPVVQIVHDNLCSEDARRIVQICLDALNREFTGAAPPLVAAVIPLAGEVR